MQRHGTGARRVAGSANRCGRFSAFASASKIAPGIGSLVGRAVAIAQAGDVAAGFAALEKLSSDRIANYQPYWAARGHLLALLGREDEAQQAFTRAASLTDDPALRQYLFKRSLDEH